jgi:hypothetical protein
MCVTEECAGLSMAENCAVAICAFGPLERLLRSKVKKTPSLRRAAMHCAPLSL